MNLLELKYEIEKAIIRAKECEEKPEEVKVSMQIDSYTSSIWTDDVNIMYDCNFDASGCVVLGFKDEKEKE